MADTQYGQEHFCMYSCLRKKAGRTQNKTWCRLLSRVWLFLAAATLFLPAICGTTAFASDTETRYSVTVFADGKEEKVQTTGETVSALLKKAGISLSEYDEVYPAADTYITEELTIHVSRVKRSEETVFETVEADTRYVSSDDLVKGESRTVRAPADGQKLCHYEVMPREDGQKTYTLLKEICTVAPVQGLVEVGGGTITTASGETLAYTRVMEVTSIAYTTEGRKHPERARTSTGTIPKVGTVAVDPKKIPYGTKMYIVSADGESWVYGVATAEDCGGKIKGNRIDLFMTTRSQCLTHGVRKAKVYILE